MFAGVLSLGCMFSWVTFGASAAPQDASFFIDASQCPLHAILLRALTGCTLLALALRRMEPWRGRRGMVAAAALGVLSVVVRWCSLLVGPAALAVGGGLAGVAFALFLSGWLARYRSCGAALLVMMFLASFVADVTYMGALYLGDVASRVVVLLLPVVSVLVLRSPAARVPLGGGVAGGDRRTRGVGCGRPGSRTGLDTPFVLQVTSLLLCNFASGPACYGVEASGLSGVVLGAMVMFVLAAVFMLYGQPRLEVMFVLFAVASIFCTALVLVVDDLPFWLGGLLSGCFWALLLYSIAWFCLEDASLDAPLSPVCLAGLGSVYLLSALAEVVGTALTGGTACVMALAMVGLALSLALVRAMRFPQREQDAVTGEQVGCTQMGDEGAAVVSDACAGPSAAALSAVDVCGVLGERFGLTPGELAVCRYLARGYTLRQVAAELGIGEGAAKYHRHNIYQKCGVANRQDLINLFESAARDAQGCAPNV